MTNNHVKSLILKCRQSINITDNLSVFIIFPCIRKHFLGWLYSSNIIFFSEMICRNPFSTTKIKNLLSFHVSKLLPYNFLK